MGQDKIQLNVEQELSQAISESKTFHDVVEATNVIDLYAAKQSRSNSEKKPSIWAVASGKGGVGRTLTCTSLAIALIKQGYKVLIVDLDAIGGNVHTQLGLKPSYVSIRNFFEETKALKDCILGTNVPNLSYVQGLWDSWLPTSLTSEQANRFLQSARALPFDFVICDLSAGMSDFNFHILEGADDKFLVCTPEPTAIEKNYRFIENMLTLSLRKTASDEAFTALMKTLSDHRSRSLEKHFSFKSYLRDSQGLSYDSFEKISRKPFHLVMNMTRNQQSADVGYAIKSVCYKYFDLSLDYAGNVDFDNAVWQSIRAFEHVLLSQPFTPLMGQFWNVCKHLIDPSDVNAVI